MEWNELFYVIIQYISTITFIKGIFSSGVEIKPVTDAVGKYVHIYA